MTDSLLLSHLEKKWLHPNGGDGGGSLTYTAEAAGTVSYESTVPALTTLNSEFNDGSSVFNCAGRVNIPLTQFATTYSTQTFTATVGNNQFGTAVGTYKSTIISGNYVVDGKTLIWELDNGAWPTSPQYTLGANPLFVAPGVRPVFYEDGGGIIRALITTYNGSSWDLTQTLLEVDGGADPNLNDLCGYSIDVYNGTTLVVGAPGFINGTQRGAILIYDLVAGVWTFTQRIINTVSTIDSNVGYSVAIHDATIVAGNWIEGPSLNDGKVFIYQLKDGTWEYVEQIELASKTTNDEFGKVVDIYNKVIVVGAPGNDAGAADAGKVTVYKATSFASDSGASLVTYPSSLPSIPDADSVVGLWCAYNTVNTYAGCVYGKNDDLHFSLLHPTEAFTLKDEEDNSLKVTYNFSGTFSAP